MEGKSGILNVPKEELQSHLKKTYSDQFKDQPLSDFDDVPPVPPPETEFKKGGIQGIEIAEFVRKARAKSAPGKNGIPYKVYKYCKKVLDHLIKLLQGVWRIGIMPKEWCLADGIYIPEE